MNKFLAMAMMGMLVSVGGVYADNHEAAATDGAAKKEECACKDKKGKKNKKVCKKGCHKGDKCDKKDCECKDCHKADVKEGEVKTEVEAEAKH